MKRAAWASSSGARVLVKLAALAIALAADRSMRSGTPVAVAAGDGPRDATSETRATAAGGRPAEG